MTTLMIVATIIVASPTPATATTSSASPSHPMAHTSPPHRVTQRCAYGGFRPENDHLIYPKHTVSLLSVAWSPDGRLIASGDTAGIINVWDAISGDTIITYRGHSRFARCLAWSPDSHYIASGGDYGDNTAQVWEAIDGQAGLQAHPAIPHLLDRMGACSQGQQGEQAHCIMQLQWERAGLGRLHRRAC